MLKGTFMPGLSSLDKRGLKYLLLFFLIIALTLGGARVAYCEEDLIIGQEDEALLALVPELLFTIPDALAERRIEHKLNQPMDIAIDEDNGDIYISEANNTISIYSQDGIYRGSFGGKGNKPGQFRFAVGLFIDQKSKLLYVLDQRNFRVQVFPASRNLVAEQVKSDNDEISFGAARKKKKAKVVIPKLIVPLPMGTVPQLGEQAVLSRNGKTYRVRSTALRTDSFGKIIVLNAAVGRFLIYNREGEFLTKLEEFGKNKERLYAPNAFDLAEVEYTDQKGRKKKRIQYYVTDTMNRRIMVLTEKGDFLFSIADKGDKKATVEFSRPTGIALNDKGDIYVLDRMLAEVYIFDPQGNFILAFGQEGDLYEKLYLPLRIKISKKLKRIYITDMGNNRVMIYKLAS